MDAARLPALDLAISTFDNAWDNQPKARTTSLAGLVRALTTFRVRTGVVDKRALPAWSPARFKVGARRAADAVLELSCLVLDVDDGDLMDLDAAWSDVLHVVHSTWSHTPACPRMRLVVPLSSPVSAARWTDAFNWATGRYRGADVACKDPGRLYFAPAVPDDTCERLAKVHEGPLLDVVDRLPPPAVHSKRPRSSAIRVPARRVDDVVRGRLRTDPTARERLAEAIGARLAGAGEARRADDVPCPRCGRPAVWFWIEPKRKTRAECQHARTCAWSGDLTELVCA